MVETSDRPAQRMGLRLKLIALVAKATVLEVWWAHRVIINGFTPCEAGCREGRYPCTPRRDADLALREVGVDPFQVVQSGYFGRRGGRLRR